MKKIVTAELPHTSADLKELFIGRRIVEAHFSQECVLYELDNGVELQLMPNEGCGGCGQGHFVLTDFTKFDHLITGVKVMDNFDDRNNNREAMVELFIYGEGLSERVAVVKGSEGNAYYGRGFTLRVFRRI